MAANTACMSTICAQWPTGAMREKAAVGFPLLWPAGETLKERTDQKAPRQIDAPVHQSSKFQARRHAIISGEAAM